MNMKVQSHKCLILLAVLFTVCTAQITITSNNKRNLETLPKQLQDFLGQNYPLDTEVSIFSSTYSQSYNGYTWQDIGDIYFAETAFGQTIKQTYSLLIDTGSSYSWINQSSSYTPPNLVNLSGLQLSSQSYYNYLGNVNGYLGQDYVSFDTTFGNLKQLWIPNFTFIYATSSSIYDNFSDTELSSYEFSDWESDINFYPNQSQRLGVLGLGPANSQQNTSFTDAMFTALHLNTTDDKYFSLFLKANPYQTQQQTEIMFGAFDQNRMNDGETFQYIPVSNINNGWTITVENYSVGQDTENINRQAILTSGIQYIGVPTQDLQNILQQINSQDQEFDCEAVDSETGHIQCDCELNNLQYFPDIMFTTSTGQQLVIPKSYYMMFYPMPDAENRILRQRQQQRRLQSEGESFSIPWGDEGLVEDTEEGGFGSEGEFYSPLIFPYFWYEGWPTNGNKCFLWLQDTKYITNNIDFQSYWILGIPFLQNYYTIFSESNQSIGFTPAKQPLFVVGGTSPYPGQNGGPPGSPGNPGGSGNGSGSSSGSSGVYWIIIGVVAGILVIALVISCIRNMNQSQQLNNGPDYSAQNNGQPKKKRGKKKKNGGQGATEVIIVQENAYQPQTLQYSTQPVQGFQYSGQQQQTYYPPTNQGYQNYQYQPQPYYQPSTNQIL